MEIPVLKLLSVGANILHPVLELEKWNNNKKTPLISSTLKHDGQ
jgi:hypothetical protein